jgi:hypothetical protein
MIYVLAEFCLNSLNDTFYSSTKQLQTSNILHIKYSPLLSIYILVLGFNSINLSVIFSQILFLYNLFYKIDINFINLIKINTDLTIIEYIPIIPLFIAISLNCAYITDINRYNSLISRILYTLSHSIINSIFTWNNILVIKLLELAFSFLVLLIFSKLYLLSPLKTSAIVFSFTGSYFFLKTYFKNDYFTDLFEDRKFEFSYSFKELPSESLLKCYLTFIMLSTCSFLIQMGIRLGLQRITKKYKLE